MDYNYPTINGAPPMSMATGGDNLLPQMSMAPQAVIAPQQDPTAIFNNPVIQRAIQQYAEDNGADERTKKIIENMKALKQSGLFETPYQKNMQAHPILGALATGAMAFGQGLTKQPFLTDFQSNQAALQKQSMEMMQEAAKTPLQPNVPIINIGADGQPQIVGNAPKGSIVNKPSSRMLSPETNQDIAERIKNGDAVLSGFSKYQAGQIAQYLPKDFNIQKSELAFKAKQSAMGDIKTQDNKVNLANNIMGVFEKAYDPKTGNYNIPPSQHVELALNYAKMVSPNGVIAQDLVDKMKQKTGREKLAAVAIYFGADPNEVGGSTQSVLKWFRDNTDAQAKIAEKARSKYQQGGVSDYVGVPNGGVNPYSDPDKEARYQAYKAQKASQK